MQVQNKIEPNANQKRAIELINGTIMVLAGPGTGKTYTIIERIKHMINMRIDSGKILCMTFSEAAATEMKTRLEKEIESNISDLKVSTYHAFCSEIIRNYSEKFDLAEGFDVIDEVRQFMIMKEVIAEYKPKYNAKLGDFMLKSSDIKDLIKKISMIKKSLVTKEQFYHIAQNGFAWQGEIDRFQEKLEIAKSHNRGTKGVEADIEKVKNKIQKAYEVWDIYEIYNKKIHENNFIDFDDMILMVLKKFEEDESFLVEIASKWDYIFVDEYQDTNKAQNSLVFALERGRGLGNLFVVGDDDQLIYAFQGAQMDNFEKFLELYPKTEVICLNENNRSTQTILDYSYNLISQDEIRLEKSQKFTQKKIDKKLTAKNSDIISKDRKIQLHQFGDIKQENNFVVDEIERIINSDELPLKGNGEPDLSKIAILTSKNDELHEFANLLKGKGILYQIKETKNIFEIKSVILAYFYLKILENSRLYMDKLYGLILSAPFNFNVKDYTFLITKANVKNKDDFITIIRENLDHAWEEPEKVKAFINTYDELKRIKSCEDLKNIIMAVINKTGILSYFTNSVVNRYDNIMGLKKLIEQAELFVKYKKTYSITDFVKYLDTAFNSGIEIKVDEDLFTKNAIQLSTIHSSKGKEYDFVFMVNLISSDNGQKCSDDFTLPIKDYSYKYDDLSSLKKALIKTENLKKLFVAVTRAKYGLYLTFSDKNGKRSQIMNKDLSNINDESLVEHYNHSIDSDINLNEVAKYMNQEKLDYSIFLRKDLEACLEGFVLSASAMNYYLNCPAKFYFEKVIKVPIKDGDFKYLDYGNAIHATLEWIYKNNDCYPDIEKIKEVYIKNLNSRPFSSQVEREAFEIRGLQNLEKFYPKMILTPFERVVSIEEELEVFYEQWKIKGTIDRVDVNDDGTYTIYDYKTGNGVNYKYDVKKGGKKENYYNQLMFYKLLYELKYPERVVSKAILLYPETQTCIGKSFTKDEMQMLKDNIKYVYENIQDLNFAPCVKDKSICDECSYNQLCSLYKGIN